MKRREFLVTTGSALLGSACWNEARTAHAPFIDRIGLQLYTVRDMMAQDFEGTLATVARIGYQEVEFAGYFDRTPGQVHDALASAGLTSPATHLENASMLEDDWDDVVASARAIGHQYVVVAWIDAHQRRTVADWRRIAALLERRGADARAAGLTLAYHNHSYEFEDLGGGVIGYDILCEETSAENVPLEMDLFWTVQGGRDPLDYFARYPGRFPCVHVKDMAADGRMVDPGRGQIDFPAIVAERDTAGIRHWFVEHDNPTNVMETLRMGYAYLHAMGR